LFAANYNLPNNQWRLISLPENPPSSGNTVEKVFGDDISGGVYGDNWVLYQYDTQKNSYGEALKLNDSLEQGRGYWIIQKTGSAVTLKMPAGSVATPDSYALKIASVTGSNSSQWTLSGNPFSSPQTLGDFFLRTDSGVCTTPCDLEKAKAEKLLHNKVWIYDGSSYVLKDKPGELNSWDGFWAASLEKSLGLGLSLQKVGASQSNIYVDKNGSGGDGSFDRPFQKIQQAIDIAVAGNTVLIRGGTYNEHIAIRKSGEPDKKIVIKNYQDEAVTIDGAGIELWNWSGIVDIQGEGNSQISNITISGINVKNSFSAGFFIVQANNITLENSSSESSSSSGIAVWKSNDITIDNNTVTQACSGSNFGSGVQIDESITIAFTESSIVSNNTVSDNAGKPNNEGYIEGGEGIDVKQGSQGISVINNHVFDINGSIGIYIDAWDTDTSGISVSNNFVHDISDTGIAMATERGGVLSDIYVNNNIVYNSYYGGISIEDQTQGADVEETIVRNVKIINNTLYKNEKCISVENKHADKIAVINNICSENGLKQIAIDLVKNQSSVTIDHNLIDRADSSTGTNMVIGDPSFKVSSPLSRDDFSLNVGSLAIDAGTPVPSVGDIVFNKDRLGVSRPQGKGWDIGAFESQYP
jgi:hypothetical protein